MSIKIKLESDFSDYYDHRFASSYQAADFTFSRVASGGLKRSEQFELLEDVGWTTPTHGTAADLMSRENAKSSDLVVVYHNEMAHRGEGKVLAPLGSIAKHSPNKLCSYFVESVRGTITNAAVSRRLLCIGDRTFWLEYSNKYDWRSNVGECVSVKVLGEGLSRLGYFAEAGPDWRGDLLDKYPLWAVDFVQPAGRDELYAIDFNSAPGLSGTGIRDIVTAKDAYSEIERFLFLHRRAIAR